MVPEMQAAKAVLEGMAAIVVIRTVVGTRHHRDVKMVVVLVEDTTTTRIREEVAEATATTTRVDGHQTKEAEDRVRADLEAVVLFVVVVAAIAVEEEAVVVLEDHRPVDMVVAVVDLTILTSGKYTNLLHF